MYIYIYIRLLVCLPSLPPSIPLCLSPRRSVKLGTEQRRLAWPLPFYLSEFQHLYLLFLSLSRLFVSRSRSISPSRGAVRSGVRQRKQQDGC